MRTGAFKLAFGPGCAGVLVVIGPSSSLNSKKDHVMKSRMLVVVVLLAVVSSPGCAGLNKQDQAAKATKPAPVLGAVPDQNDPRNWYDYDALGF